MKLILKRSTLKNKRAETDVRDNTKNETPFQPEYDAAGNQTLIKTSTGIWSVSYNVDMRPTSFSQAQGDHNTIIECDYDYMGRRYTKKVTNNGTVSLHQRYIYRGYLQIACVDLRRSEHPALWYITWDPTEPIATRPLAIQINATWYSYSHDLTKNVTELYKTDGLIATSYDYSPYGAVSVTGSTQAIQWSSECYDPELALTYYNYRHYNPTDGRWINRDPIGEGGGFNLYSFIGNGHLRRIELLGLMWNQLTDWALNNVSFVVEASVNKVGDILANALGYKNQAEMVAQLDKLVGNPEIHRGDWIDAIQDGIKWRKGLVPPKTDYDINSATSNAIKEATQGQELITQFLKKNKNAKKCSEWKQITNIILPFGLKEFIENLPNGQSHFVGRARGDVSIQIQKNKIIATFLVTNATHIKSLLYHIPGTENLEEKREGRAMSTWTQTYSWTETYCCEE